jgi:hypothetical protein
MLAGTTVYINFFIPKNVFEEGIGSAGCVAENKAYILPKCMGIRFNKNINFYQRND